MTEAHALIILKAVEITVLHVTGEFQCEAGSEVREAVLSLANTKCWDSRQPYDLLRGSQSGYAFDILCM